jgi:hypothetical protein
LKRGNIGNYVQPYHLGIARHTLAIDKKIKLFVSPVVDVVCTYCS